MNYLDKQRFLKIEGSTYAHERVVLSPAILVVGVGLDSSLQ